MFAGIDTGGTFTDCVYLQAGKLLVEKLLSTPENPAQAVLAGLSRFPSQPQALIHGTTVATNALLERKLARTALLVSAGFKDILQIGRQNRPELYALHTEPVGALIPREDCFEVSERIGSQGEILEPLTEESVARLLQGLPSEIESVAICLLFSYRNPEHEEMLLRALQNRSWSISLSSQILPEYREVERFSTTVANAALQPVMQRYMLALKQGLLELPCRLVQSNGGSIALEEVAEQPVRCVLSGPAGGVLGAWEVGQQLGKLRLLSLDMGGTSTDVSLINESLPLQTETQISGIPLKVPMLAIHTVGAGGGSILRYDAGGALRVGPESAGADPGPLCYGKGQDLTVTDAQVFLGRIPEGIQLGGNLSLKPQGLERAFTELGKAIGLTAEKVALGALAVANARMERALRVVSVEKGENPADYLLFCFGGAGGLHACELARSLGIKQILIPAYAGVFSAWGMLFAPEIRDFSLTVLGECKGGDYQAVRAAFQRLELRAQKAFKTSLECLDCVYQVDLRYPGQSYELTVAWGPHAETDFHEKHAQLHHFSRPESSPEWVTLRLRVTRPGQKPLISAPILPQTSLSEALLFSRTVGFDSGRLETAFYQRAALPAETLIQGPAVILEETSTSLVLPGFEAWLDGWGHLWIQEQA